MANIQIRTQKIPRTELQRMVAGNERLLRLLENLTQDVVVTLPDALSATIDLTPVYAAIGINANDIAALQLRVAILEAQLMGLERRMSSLDQLRRKLDELEQLAIGA